jgi:transposase
VLAAALTLFVPVLKGVQKVG